MYRPTLLGFRSVEKLNATCEESLLLTEGLRRSRATYFPGNLGQGGQDLHEKTRPVAALPHPRGSGKPLAEKNRESG